MFDDKANHALAGNAFGDSSGGIAFPEIIVKRRYARKVTERTCRRATARGQYDKTLFLLEGDAAKFTILGTD